MPVRDHTTGRAAHQRRLGLDPDHKPAAVPVNGGHVQSVQADQQVATLAVAAAGTAA